MAGSLEASGDPAFTVFMIHILLILALLLGASTPSAAQPALAAHSPEEIAEELVRFAQAYPERVLLDTIGWTEYFHYPLLLVKVSNSPQQVQAKPALLFIGQVHAEEFIGVELTLHLLNLLLENPDDEQMMARMDGLEIYFIPTLNPDGLHLVMSGVDNTFRKNCRDNIGDGRLRVVAGVGRDSSGVDLNRNFGLHWDRGDSLFFNNGAIDAFNYYRGPAPFSEPETRALRDLMLSRRFLFAVSYHASRSGQNAELVIGPWNWDGRYPPDDNVIRGLGDALADRLPTQNHVGTYAAVRATQRVGQEQGLGLPSHRVSDVSD